MRPLRISAISYLNTAPLMWDFEHGEAGNEFEISYTLPSACARALQAGTADIGIIPAAAYAQVPGLMALPGVAIASRRPVRSILLVSRVPIEKMLAQHDAGLLIGDPALQIDRSRYLTIDLAEEWIRHTGKPFVFAFWAVRQNALREVAPSQDLAAIFQQSRDHGLDPASLDHIAREWAPRLSLKESDVRSYLTENIYYHLDAACLEGLQLFYRYASEIGALPAAPELRFLVSADATANAAIV
ncbi:MAG: menaquinone biosynthesis protein [Candidatus Sulfotelmatobacter sp.]